MLQEAETVPVKCQLLNEINKKFALRLPHANGFGIEAKHNCAHNQDICGKRETDLPSNKIFSVRIVLELMLPFGDHPNILEMETI